MVTEVETKERAGAKPITLEELGEMIGIPIKVRPWWGSRRERPRLIHRHCGSYVERPWGWGSYYCFRCHQRVESEDIEREPYHPRWLCPGGENHTQPKFPEIQNGKIIIWEGRCRFRYYWGQPKIHDHAQTIEVKGVSSKAMLIVIRRKM